MVEVQAWSGKRSKFKENPNKKIEFVPSPRRVRAVLAGETVADTTRAMLMRETGHVPVYYFPREDLRRDLFEATDHHTHCPYKGDASYWTAKVEGQVEENLAWSYLDPFDEIPEIGGYVSFHWDRMDQWLEEDEGHPGANREALMAAIGKIGSWNKERRMRRFARRAAAAADQARAYLALKAAEDKVHATYGDKVEKSRAKQRKQALDLWKEALQHRDEVHQVRADAKDHWFESHCAHRRPLAAAYETLWKGDLDRAEAHALLACLHTLEEVHWHLSPYDPTPWREDFLLSVTKGMEHASLIQPPVTLFSDEFLSPQSCLKDLLVLLLEQDRLSARLTSSPNPRRTIHSDTGPTLMVGDWAATTRPEAGFGAIMGQGIDEKGTATTDGQLIWRERWTGMKRSCKDK